MIEDDELRMPSLPEGDPLPADEAPPPPDWIKTPDSLYDRVTHRYKHVACGETAFLLMATPVKGQNIMAMPKVVHVDGEPHLLEGDQMFVACDHCGQTLVQLHVRHVEPLGAGFDYKTGR